MIKLPYILAGAAIIILLPGCKSKQYVQTDTMSTVKTETLGQTDGVIQKMLFGQWTATKVGDQTVSGDNRPSVIFEKDSSNPYLVRYYANNGCNTLNGILAVTPGGKMEAATEGTSTMMLCHDAPYETGVNMALNSVRTYIMEKTDTDYLLYMKDANGMTTMVLRKAQEKFINGAWKVTAIGETKIPSGKNIKFVIDLPEHKIHGNAGCNVFNGSLSESPDVENSLRIDKVATTRMMCPDMDLEQRFLEALSNVRTVAPGNGNTATMFDASGQQVISLTRIEATE